MICKKCGAKLPDNLNFCTECGASDFEKEQQSPLENEQLENVQEEDVQVAATEEEAAPAPEEMPKNSKKKNMLYAFLGLIVGFCVIAAVAGFAVISEYNEFAGKKEFEAMIVRDWYRGDEDRQELDFTLNYYEIGVMAGHISLGLEYIADSKDDLGYSFSLSTYSSDSFSVSYNYNYMDFQTIEYEVEFAEDGSKMTVTPKSSAYFVTTDIFEGEWYPVSDTYDTVEVDFSDYINHIANCFRRGF